ncbi:MAG: hypothetical protein NTZ48_06530 [Candidatus Omnitrophica bacterium]|nr:hypothetical protein [Candidatus Omnitrophota bacterium]
MKNIVLVGFMATGKTSVARELVKRFNRDYVSIDSLVEEKEKRTIKEIFAQSGEKYFRDAESKIIREISDKENLIIDAGGGAVIREENVVGALLRKGGLFYRYLGLIYRTGNRKDFRDCRRIKSIEKVSLSK